MSRDKILAAIRKNKPEEIPLPEVSAFPKENADLVSQFIELLEKVGAEVRQLKKSELAKIDIAKEFPEAATICSNIADIPSKNIDIDTIDDPHKLAHVDLAIIQGDFGVAENGAIWVRDDELKIRALPFITQHLIIAVPKKEIVWNMHEAYKRLEIERPGYGVFISGPSKTADIEQSLVIGAHGPKSLNVYLVEE